MASAWAGWCSGPGPFVRAFPFPRISVLEPLACGRLDRLMTRSKSRAAKASVGGARTAQPSMGEPSARNEASDRPAVELAGLRRRLASMLYESMLLLGVLALTFLVPYLMLGIVAEFAPPGWLLWLHVFGVLGVYFVWYWRRGGQTLAMQTWRLKIVTACRGPHRFARALLAALCARVALGAARRHRPGVGAGRSRSPVPPRSPRRHLHRAAARPREGLIDCALPRPCAQAVAAAGPVPTPWARIGYHRSERRCFRSARPLAPGASPGDTRIERWPGCWPTGPTPNSPCC